MSIDDDYFITKGRRPIMLKRLLISLTIACVAPVAAAFPEKPVKLVVPYSPGGLTDQLARKMANELSDVWGEPVIVENRPGAGSSIGASYVARSKPDGHTFLLGSVGMVTNPLMLPKMPYDPVALPPLAVLATAPNVLYVHPSVPAESVDELVSFAKETPGVLTFASSGVGSSPHLAAELFASKAEIDVIQVPYGGTGPAVADFLGGQVNAYFDTMQSMTYAKDGLIRPLAVATRERLDDEPDLPTVEESESAKGVFTGSWFGIYVPADTPADIQTTLEQAFQQVTSEDRKSTRLNSSH